MILPSNMSGQEKREKMVRRPGGGGGRGGQEKREKMVSAREGGRGGGGEEGEDGEWIWGRV